MNKKDKKEYSIQAVSNAMRLFDEFRDGEELGVTALSRRLDLHKNNVFRVLATLEQHGYIEQNPDTDGYRLGVGALLLGQAYMRGGDLMVRGRAVVRDLADLCSESVHLGILRGHEVIHVDGAPSGRMVGSGLRVGERLPAHCTALGKVLLGSAPAVVREDYDREVAARGLEERTPASIIDRHKLQEQLRTSAVRGFAVDHEECEDGLVCAAAPVFDSDGVAVAALSISAPAFRADDARLMAELVPQVTAAALRLSRELGYVTE